MHASLFFEDKIGLEINDILQWLSSFFIFGVFEICMQLLLDAILDLKCTIYLATIGS